MAVAQSPNSNARCPHRTVTEGGLRTSRGHIMEHSFAGRVSGGYTTRFAIELPHNSMKSVMLFASSLERGVFVDVKGSVSA